MKEECKPAPNSLAAISTTNDYKDYYNTRDLHRAAVKAYERSAAAVDRENAAAKRQRRRPDKQYGDNCFAAYDLVAKLQHKLSWEYPSVRQDRLNSIPSHPMSTQPHESTRVRGVNRFTRSATKTLGGDRGQAPGF